MTRKLTWYARIASLAPNHIRHPTKIKNTGAVINSSNARVLGFSCEVTISTETWDTIEHRITAGHGTHETHQLRIDLPDPCCRAGEKISHHDFIDGQRHDDQYHWAEKFAGPLTD